MAEPAPGPRTRRLRVVGGHVPACRAVPPTDRVAPASS